MAEPGFLLTRPAAQSARFAAMLRAAYPTAIIEESPILAPVLLPFDLPPGTFDAVIFTSETGVQAALPQAASLPRHAYVVGDRTALAAQAAGFRATSAQGDAAALVDLILSEKPKRCLHLHGQDTRGEVAAHLTAAGVPTEARVVYRQDPQPLSDAALTLLAGEAPLIAPLFSPRSAALFAQAARDAIAPLWLASLSNAVDSAAEIPAARRQIAAEPTAAALLAAIARLFDTPR